MTETRTAYTIPELAVELPTHQMYLEFPDSPLALRTTVAYILNALQETLSDWEDGDFARLRELARSAQQELNAR